MTEVVVTCGFCQWTSTFQADPSRADQTAYNVVWQHVAAAHWTSAREIRAMGIRTRKEALLSWVKMTPASPASSTPTLIP